MRSLTLAALAAATLTAGVAHSNVIENLALKYQSGATFDGTLVLSDDFSSIASVTGTLTGYDSSATGFQGLCFSDLITSVSPLNYDLAPSTFFSQLGDSTFANFLDFGYSYDSSGITLSAGGVELEPSLGLAGYNNINYDDQVVSGSVTPVPEPGALALFSIGLLSLGATRHRTWRRARSLLPG